MAVILIETVFEIKSLLDYAMYRTDNVEQIKDALHRINLALNRDAMYKFDNLELQQKNEAIEISEIDKTIEKLTKLKLNLQLPNTARVRRRDFEIVGIKNHAPSRRPHHAVLN